MMLSAGCLLASAALAAQTPAPAAAPMPMPMPMAAPAPPAPPADMAPLAPLPPLPPEARSLGYGSLDIFQNEDLMALKGRAATMAKDAVRLNLDGMRLQLDDVKRNAELIAQSAQYGAMDVFKYGRTTGSQSAEGLYSRGQSALDRRRYDEALEAFTQAVSKGGARADAALYWKAYTLHKLGKRDESLAAIAELRKSYPSSRWLEDAKALEIEVKQASGQAVSPDSQPDEDLKLMALNGLMQNDPERAIPALEGLLKGAQSPRLKEQTLFVLAQSSSPKAQQMLEQVARGGGNPDLQVKAIQYMGAVRKRSADGQKQTSASAPLLAEIYSSTSDVNVKRAILNALVSSRDTDRLLQIVKSEKDAGLRREAVQRVTSFRTAGVNDSLVQVYASEQDKEVKRAIVNSFSSQDGVKQLVAAARSEKDPEMVRYIVQRLAGMKSPEAADFLMEVLKK
jgi:tetratricopeptide (TPR) repeat protein